MLVLWCEHPEQREKAEKMPLLFPVTTELLTHTGPILSAGPGHWIGCSFLVINKDSKFYQNGITLIEDIRTCYRCYRVWVSFILLTLGFIHRFAHTNTHTHARAHSQVYCPLFLFHPPPLTAEVWPMKRVRNTLSTCCFGSLMG